ncbi:MAG: enoyl-CoA hydratase/isomerase family protein [Gemmatimonadetes bacterium]|nr:enoyl-CoA hydratase/isomerase family protein [Gemmatimonadota bacterium]
MSGTDTITIERDGNLGWIRINRPERLNAFAGDMRERLDQALQELDGNGAVRCVAITGVGRAFSTGGDVQVMAELAENGDAEGFEELVRTGIRVVKRIDQMRKPVIAAVNGAAAGAGACLALACDLRIASQNATIGLTFIRVGLHPDWGGAYFLPRVIGSALAAELVMTGGMINAKRAERLGLFNRVVPADELESAVRGLAGQIAGGPPDVIADAKRTLRRSLAADLDEILEMEADAQLKAFRSPDFNEGIGAFLEKRAPRFGR